MTIQPNTHFSSALEKIVPQLTDAEKRQASASIQRVIEKVAGAYEDAIGRGFVGVKGTGVVDSIKASVPVRPPVGLIYGRIQSGKTRTMILSSALALDNKFRIVVVLTTNMNRLVDQTSDDFREGLPDIKILSKADLMPTTVHQQAELVKKMLEMDGNFGVVVVCSKGSTVLEHIIQFLGLIEAEKYPAVIFDDEGDQATLDTTVQQRSTKGQPETPSRIHSLVHSQEIASLRSSVPNNVFVSVTGTPQGIVLQNMDSASRPSFIELIEPGNGYSGGETFFNAEEPESNDYIEITDAEEKIDLLGEDGGVPQGLKNAICFFLLSASAAYTATGEWQKFKLLCHPSVKQQDHNEVGKTIHDFIVNELLDAINNLDTHPEIQQLLQTQYDNLKSTVPTVPELSCLVEIIKSHLAQHSIIIINAKTTSQNLQFSQYYNFLIGGNSIGRGLAIKKLLVTYYVREPKTSTMDTMYQHARMFGYRAELLPFTRVFLPPQLYFRFHQIYNSDEELRSFIQSHGDQATSLLVRTVAGTSLKPTRSNILDANRTKVLVPGSQVYPDYPIFKEPTATRILNNVTEYLEQLGFDYKNALEISTDQAIELVSKIKTKSTNVWRDKQVADYFLSLKNQLGTEQVILKYREAPNRRNKANGLLAVGVLGGDVVKSDSLLGKPVLWIFKVNGSTDNGWDGVDFIYPTLVIPKVAAPLVFNA